jgi:hypothetical protein
MPLHVTDTEPATNNAPGLIKVMFNVLLASSDLHNMADETMPHLSDTAALIRPAGKAKKMLPPDVNAVDVVNVTLKEAEPDTTAVVMLSALADAEMQPMHGIDKNVGTVSLEV